MAGLQLEKKKMDSVFGRKRTLKSGGEGITYEYPTTLTLHTNKQYIEKWINYSVLDSESTFYLKTVLEGKSLDYSRQIRTLKKPDG